MSFTLSSPFAPEVLYDLEERNPLLFRLDPLVAVTGQVDPLLRQIVHYEQVSNELLQHFALCGGTSKKT